MKRIPKHVPKINEKAKRVILEEIIKDAIEEKVAAIENLHTIDLLLYIQLLVSLVIFQTSNVYLL